MLVRLRTRARRSSSASPTLAQSADWGHAPSTVRRRTNKGASDRPTGRPPPHKRAADQRHGRRQQRPSTFLLHFPPPLFLYTFLLRFFFPRKFPPPHFFSNFHLLFSASAFHLHFSPQVLVFTSPNFFLHFSSSLFCPAVLLSFPAPLCACAFSHTFCAFFFYGTFLRKIHHPQKSWMLLTSFS